MLGICLALMRVKTWLRLTLISSAKVSHLTRSSILQSTQQAQPKLPWQLTRNSSGFFMSQAQFKRFKVSQARSNLKALAERRAISYGSRRITCSPLLINTMLCLSGTLSLAIWSSWRCLLLKTRFKMRKTIGATTTRRATKTEQINSMVIHRRSSASMWLRKTRMKKEKHRKNNKKEKAARMMRKIATDWRLYISMFLADRKMLSKLHARLFAHVKSARVRSERNRRKLTNLSLSSIMKRSRLWSQCKQRERLNFTECQKTILKQNGFWIRAHLKSAKTK